MKKISDNKFLKHWFVFFNLYLLMLLFIGWNLIAVSRKAEPPSNQIPNESLLFIFLISGLLSFVFSFFSGKSYRGFLLALSLCLFTSFIGMLILFVQNTVYFFLRFIIGHFGTGVHLLRYNNFLNKI